MAANHFGKDDIVIEKRETLFQGFYRLDKLHLRHRQFAGGMGPLLTRELFVRPPAVGVLIYDPATDEVLLIEQCRVGALDDIHPWQMEIVAGLVEPGEQPEDVVRREAEEEAGVVLGKVERVMEFMPSPGASDERFALYVASADLSQAGGVHGLPEEGEDIRVNVMSVNQALSALDRGRINNAPCILALQWLALNKPRLLARWKK
ncbi:MAG: NUDIX domain-containing protein [Moraxellaceae bacterium]|jgi:ADP-ribose pyrophosphatase|nr:NUDIX domain-containing protein [Moraxellaceae bacterium]MBP8853237.1 NUDIX domain-containing protein [Moraxellaceae bacterium]MBP9046583.1 NUDIX domain-containing protein [Moraxellaceae bacterium]MBP9731243.1 NUDIX domain-containing protein [Moraxellaceae bacterium]MCC6199173.1 NUDIX domain-containing protein [Moraxellaceae bacterium]